MVIVQAPTVGLQGGDVRIEFSTPASDMPEGWKDIKRYILHFTHLSRTLYMPHVKQSRAVRTFLTPTTAAMLLNFDKVARIAGTCTRAARAGTQQPCLLRHQTSATAPLPLEGWRCHVGINVKSCQLHEAAYVCPA